MLAVIPLLLSVLLQIFHFLAEGLAANWDNFCCINLNISRLIIYYIKFDVYNSLIVKFIDNESHKMMCCLIRSSFVSIAQLLV